jgi:hypothetical protein
MIRWLSLAVVSFVLLNPGAVVAQPAKESSAEDQAVRKARALLTENRISLKATEQPLAKILELLEKQLPEGTKIALRIDTDAFGKDAAKIKDAPIKLPKLENVSLSTALRLAIGQIGRPTDYRLGADGFVITTPARALYTSVHDIRDFVEHPEMLQGGAGTVFPAVRNRRDARPLDSAQKAAAIVRLILSAVAPESWYPTTEPHGTIQIRNETQLIVKANAEHHAQIAELFDALRRLSDVSVTLTGRLYSVDRDTYMNVKNRKRLTRAELEALEEKAALPEKDNPEDGGLGKILRIQKPTVEGLPTKIGNGQEGVFLSQYRVTCVPPLLHGKVPAGVEGSSLLTEPQVALEGVAFSGRVVVSADRRFVRLKVTEKATEIDELPKVQAPKIKKELDVQEQVEELLAALRRAGPLEPVLSETAHSHEMDIPDGGSLVMAVRVRPRALETAERWWLLVVSGRIVINEEERAIREAFLSTSLPALLKDILTNPALKTTRAFYGSPDDTRFALVGGERWTWPPAAEPLAVPGHPLTPAVRKGKRLLGVRIDDFQWSGKDQSELAITVSLLNAGGTENGLAPGVGRLRYLAKTKDKKPVVELLDSVEP